MKVLVIPDVHLKPWMFTQASSLLKVGCADLAVCLMDIADDWRQQYNIDLYIETYDAAIQFAKDYPKTLWCYGNHDLSYEWNQKESGYSPIAPWTVCKKLEDLREALLKREQIAYLHRIDNVLFCHGGLADIFVQEYVSESDYDDAEKVIATINAFGRDIMWQDLSPIWCRPQYYGGKMYKEEELLQVVGHTPVEKITREKNLISCDVFSTYQNGRLIGTREYLVLDTVTWEMEIVKTG